jgi:hypothetical protein
MRKKSPSAMSVFLAKPNKFRKRIRVIDFSEKKLDKQHKIQIGCSANNTEKKMKILNIHNQGMTDTAYFGWWWQAWLKGRANGSASV